MNSSLSLGDHCPMFELTGIKSNEHITCKLSDIQMDIHLIFFPGAFTDEGLALKTYLEESKTDTSKLILISTDSTEVLENFFKGVPFEGWILSDVHHSSSIDYHCFNDADAHSYPAHIHMNEKHELISYYQGTMEVVIELAHKR